MSVAHRCGVSTNGRAGQFIRLLTTRSAITRTKGRPVAESVTGTEAVITVVQEIKLRVPRLPNFIGVVGSKEMLDVRNLSKESIEDIADAWRRAFRDHCARPCTLEDADGSEKL